MLTVMDTGATEAEVSGYLLAHCSQPDALLRELAEETAATFPDAAVMQIAHDEAELLSLLVRLTAARNIVEVGVFTGYSSLCMARAMAPGGRLLACDVSEEWTAVARRYWERAGVADRIDLRLGPALDTLRALPRDPVVDLAFIDADKTGYRDYYEELVTRVRPGGVLVLDNVLLGGRVLGSGPGHDSEAAAAVRAVNDAVAADDRVETVMLPVRDGVTIARRRDG